MARLKSCHKLREVLQGYNLARMKNQPVTEEDLAPEDAIEAFSGIWKKGRDNVAVERTEIGYVNECIFDREPMQTR